MTDSNANGPQMGKKTVLWHGLVYVGWRLGAVVYNRANEPVFRAEVRILGAKRHSALDDLHEVMNRQSDGPDDRADHSALVRFEMASYSRRIHRLPKEEDAS